MANTALCILRAVIKQALGVVVIGMLFQFHFVTENVNAVMQKVECA